MDKIDSNRSTRWVLSTFLQDTKGTLRDYAWYGEKGLHPNPSKSLSVVYALWGGTAEVIVEKASMTDLTKQEDSFFSLSLDVFLPVTLPSDYSDLVEHSFLPVAPPLKQHSGWLPVPLCTLHTAMPS